MTKQLIKEMEAIAASVNQASNKLSKEEMEAIAASVSQEDINAFKQNNNAAAWDRRLVLCCKSYTDRFGFPRTEKAKLEATKCSKSIDDLIDRRVANSAIEDLINAVDQLYGISLTATEEERDSLSLQVESAEQQLAYVKSNAVLGHADCLHMCALEGALPGFNPEN